MEYPIYVALDGAGTLDRISELFQFSPWLERPVAVAGCPWLLRILDSSGDTFVVGSITKRQGIIGGLKIASCLPPYMM